MFVYRCITYFIAFLPITFELGNHTKLFH